jgi:hypothetical protein
VESRMGRAHPRGLRGSVQKGRRGRRRIGGISRDRGARSAELGSSPARSDGAARARNRRRVRGGQCRGGASARPARARVFRQRIRHPARWQFRRPLRQITARPLRRVRAIPRFAQALLRSDRPRYGD